MSGYTITLAKSARGKYHISRVDGNLHETTGDGPTETARLTPVCGARASQRTTAWAGPTAETGAETLARFRRINEQLLCPDCGGAATRLEEAS